MCDSTQNTVYCAPRAGADIRWLTYYYDQVHDKSTELSKAVSGEWDRPRYRSGCQQREGRMETMNLLHSLITHAERLKSGIQWKTGENTFGKELQDLKVVWSSLIECGPLELEEGNTTQSVGSLHFALHCRAIGGMSQEQKTAKDACDATHLSVRALWSSLRMTYALFYGVVSLFASGKDSNDLCALPALLFSADSEALGDDESLMSYWSPKQIQRLIECLTSELEKKVPATPDTINTSAGRTLRASSIGSVYTFNTMNTEP